MSRQMQHVQLERKLALRRRLLSELDAPGAVYVPFIGDGDIAAELYTGRTIYGADLDPKRVEVAASRLPGATVVVADCDRWPVAFEGVDATFAVADFDAYVYPYHAFRAWWASAEKADRVAVFFTDGMRQSVKRTGAWVLPDGSRGWDESATLADRRRLYNAWWAQAVLPWFNGAVSGWHIVMNDKYQRANMLYWGAVLERDGWQAMGSDSQPAPVNRSFGTAKQRAYAAARLSGLDQHPAAERAGYSRSSEPARVERDCIRLGLLPDPRTEAAAIRDTVRTIEEMRAEAREATIRQLHEKRHDIVAALVEAAVSGNVQAIKEGLDRLTGPEPVVHAGIGKDGEPVPAIKVTIDLAEDARAR